MQSPGVAVEDRDWYRNDPPKGVERSASPSDRAIRHDPRGVSWRAAAFIAVLLAFWVVEGGAMLDRWGSPTDASITWIDDHLISRIGSDKPTNTERLAGGAPRPNVAPDANRTSVSLAVRAAALKRAVYPGRTCVTVDGQRRICADYAVGQRPASRLRAALERAGYTVRLVRVR